MTRLLRPILLLSLMAAMGIAVTGPRAHAQSGVQAPNSTAQQAHASVAGAEHMDAPESEGQQEQYVHSPTVQAIARFAHVKTDTAAQIFEDLNSGVLLIAIFAFLWKVMPKLFRTRSESLQKELVGARKATEDANRRLAEVEARLMRLDTEIDAIRRQVEQEMAEDEKHIHAALEAERERIIASAEQEITAVQAAAQRDLKKFAADLAIDHAMRKLQLSSDADRALVRDFGKGLKNRSGGEA
jgi:F-type H+-transporting ATPase subunit b